MNAPATMTIPAIDEPAMMAVVLLDLVLGEVFTGAAVALSAELEWGAVVGVTVVMSSVVNRLVVNSVATWVVNRVVVDWVVSWVVAMIVGCVGVDVVDVRVVVTDGTGDESLHDAVGGHNPASASEESAPAAWRPVNEITFTGKK
jgi:hypothetical protein